MTCQCTIFINNSGSSAIFQSVTCTILLICIFDVQGEESSSYTFDNTDSSAIIQANDVSQPKYDDKSNKPFSVSENRYKNPLYLNKSSLSEQVFNLWAYELHGISMNIVNLSRQFQWVHVTFYIGVKVVPMSLCYLLHNSRDKVFFLWCNLN